MISCVAMHDIIEGSGIVAVCNLPQNNVHLFYTYKLRVILVSGCPEGDVRLLEGSSSLEGRVEFCKESMWGSICQNQWDSNDAKVVCRQLGLSTAGL